MAKTLKDFLEGYLKVKSADEQKFVDKHVTAKNPDRNGNGDDVFNGNTKPIDRRKERKGYNPGEDEKVYEALKGNQHKIDANKNGKVDAHDFKLLRGKKKVAEEAEELEELSTNTLRNYRAKAKDDAYDAADVDDDRRLRKRSMGSWDAGKKILKRGDALRKEEAEELEELSKATVGSYAQKAKDELSRTEYLAGKKMGERMHGAKVDNAERKLNTKASKRYKGLGMAINKLAKEEVEELDEKLTAKTPMGTYIKDFKKSDAPQFKGKSPEKRRVMAIAAKLSAERGGKPLRKEERLQNRINDLSEVHQRTMMHVFEKLNEDNKSKFLNACDTPEGVENMLDFAINHRGE
jgi:hypothetical protein